MTIPRRALVIAAMALLLLGPAVAPARAQWASAELLSADARQQADHAEFPAMSADGRYVAFSASIAGRTALYRTDLVTGAVDVVASGDAAFPSLSADGRYVSFTTTVRLDPINEPVGGASDVYVRDMSLPYGSPGSFTLASALDRSTRAISYAVPGEGSAAADRVALSADGRRVAFTVLSDSNLVGGGTSTSTPGGQVAVRALDTHRTTLVTATRNGTTGAMTSQPVSGGGLGGALPSTYGNNGVGGSVSTAALSADGSTVAWLGVNLGGQVPVLASETAARANDYGEPLWRRIGDGPQAPTRRITGGADPGNPACPANGQTTPFGSAQSSPCDGPFDTDTNYGNGPGTGTLAAPSTEQPTPQLSADGWTVAILSAAPERGFDTGVPSPATVNVFVVNMHPGLTRMQALERLTAWAGYSGDAATSGEITDLGISADANRVAFTTARIQFPLSPPTLVGDPLSQVGAIELYVVDRANGTFERVTRGFDGSPSRTPDEASTGRATADEGAASPSLSADGHVVAFSSLASNLVFGDSNGASDVFSSSETIPTVNPPHELISAPPAAPPEVAPEWVLSATAHALPDGGVAIDAVVPGAGQLSATAQSQTPVGPASPRSKRTAKRTDHPGRRRARTRRTAVAPHRVASAAATPDAAGPVQLTLRVLPHYATFLGRPGGLPATVRLDFQGPPGQPALHQDLPVTFALGTPHRAPGSRRHRRHHRR